MYGERLFVCQAYWVGCVGLGFLHGPVFIGYSVFNIEYLLIKLYYVAKQLAHIIA
jgi:hypothetical protein